ncbi:MAG TPA: HAD-IA family hydrolase [Rhizomicrobium sp.]|nr:HAD-IA family hydrolase [Rhizomicrobium sp.]
MLPILIFDLDGTLVDTAPDLLNAANAVLAQRGRPSIDPATLRHMVGFGAKSLITQAFAATGAEPPPDEMPALVELFLAHYGAHLADHSRPFEGVAKTLDGLKQKGAILGVLTNKPHAMAGPLLKKLGLASFFTAVYGAGFKAYVKPDPRIFADVVAACGGGGQAVMIGDSVTDLHTARAACVPCILMSYGYTPVPAASLGADIVLDEFTSLPGALSRLHPA